MHSWVEAWFLPLPLKAQRPWLSSRSDRWDLAACWTLSTRISQGASIELLTLALVLVWELQRFSKRITEGSLLFHPPCSELEMMVPLSPGAFECVPQLIYAEHLKRNVLSSKDPFPGSSPTLPGPSFAQAQVCTGLNPGLGSKCQKLLWGLPVSPRHFSSHCLGQFNNDFSSLTSVWVFWTVSMKLW